MSKIYYFSLTSHDFSKTFYGAVQSSITSKYTDGEIDISSDDIIICYVSSIENSSSEYTENICSLNNKGIRMIPIIDNDIVIGKSNSGNSLNSILGYIWCRSHIYKRSDIENILSKNISSDAILAAIIGNNDIVRHKNSTSTQSAASNSKFAAPSATGYICIIAAVFQMVCAVLLLIFILIDNLSQNNIASVATYSFEKTADSAYSDIMRPLTAMTFYSFIAKTVFYRLDKSQYGWTRLNSIGKKTGSVSNILSLACVAEALVLFILKSFVL